MNTASKADHFFVFRDRQSDHLEAQAADLPHLVVHFPHAGLLHRLRNPTGTERVRPLPVGDAGTSSQHGDPRTACVGYGVTEGRAAMFGRCAPSLPYCLVYRTETFPPGRYVKDRSVPLTRPVTTSYRSTGSLRVVPSLNLHWLPLGLRVRVCPERV